VSVGRSISCYKYVSGHTDRACLQQPPNTISTIDPSTWPDVRVQADKSSGRQNNIVADGRAALVGLGDLRAGEEMHFLLFVNVPAASEDANVTRLLRVSCTYRDAATGKTRVVVGEDAVVLRPPDVTCQDDQKPPVEVQVERFRCQPTAGLGLLALILTMYLVLVFLRVAV
jgi:hypothetical protein